MPERVSCYRFLGLALRDHPVRLCGSAQARRVDCGA